MKIRLIGIILIVLVGINFTQIKNAAKPSKGIWDFKMEKIFEISEAGKELFNVIRTIKSNQDYIYIIDEKLVKVHIFNQQGKYIKSFGQKGEGPGEIRNIGGTGIHLVDDMVILSESGILNYYTAMGEFVRKVIPVAGVTPVAFISKDICISAPRVLRGKAKNEKIKTYNLKDGTEQLISDFLVFDKATNTMESDGRQTTVSIFIGGLTPMMTTCYSSNRIFFGMNNSYRINTYDLKTKKKAFFTVEGIEGELVSKQYLDGLKKDLNDIPSDMVKKIIDGLPKRASCFYSIFTDRNGFIYTVIPDLDSSPKAKFDIFSSEGKYLYQAHINMGEGEMIDSLWMQEDSIIFSMENEEGDVRVVKYEISLPQK